MRLGGLIVLLALLLPGPAAVAQNDLLRGNIQDPTFSPSNRALVAYSRQVEDVQKLYLYDKNAGTVRQVTADERGEEEQGSTTGGFFENNENQSLRRFEGQVAWRPVLDTNGRQWFVFVSSAGGSGYSLYLSYLTADGSLAGRTIKLPFEGQAGYPSWSPDGQQLVFSGSPKGMTGNALFLYPDVHRFLRANRGGTPANASPVPLTDNVRESLYPEWSPDGQYIAYQSRRPRGSGQSNWGISLLDIKTWAGPRSGSTPRSVRLSTRFEDYHEYKPSWSTDGSYVGFYVTQSEVGSGAGNRRQDIGVLELIQGSDGRIQGGRVLSGYTGDRLAKNVLPNETRGPVWHPVEGAPALIYVEKEENRGNPIYLADVARWSNDNSNYSRRLSAQFAKETRFHEEATATRGAEGLRLAFASQVGRSLRLQLRDVRETAYRAPATPQVRKEVSRTAAGWRSAVFPGWGQLHKGQGSRALLFALAGGAALTTAVVGATSDSDPPPREIAKTLPSRVDDEFGGTSALQSVGIAAFVGVWAFSFYDSLQGFPHYVNRPVYAGEALRVQNPRVGVMPGAEGPRVSISLRVQF